eukprot:jgi/Psemu1/209415/e_gw1.499.10.1
MRVGTGDNDFATQLLLPLSSIPLLLAAIAAATASPMITVRDVGMVAIGFVSFWAIAVVVSQTPQQRSLDGPVPRSLGTDSSRTNPSATQRSDDENESENENDRHDNHSHSHDHSHTIRTLRELRRLLPPRPRAGTGFHDAKKVIEYLDDQMIRFIERSPLLYLATVDASGTPFVSPKGDEPGFVQVLGTGDRAGTVGHRLVIPDRPGNRLLFGLQNLLENPRVSLLFAVPGTCETLRCSGTATISTDPGLLARHRARGCTPKLVLVVDVDRAFFHCAKAYLRSGIWKTNTRNPLSQRPDHRLVEFGRYFAPNDPELADRINQSIDEHYESVQRAIDGVGEEVED